MNIKQTYYGPVRQVKKNIAILVFLVGLITGFVIIQINTSCKGCEELQAKNELLKKDISNCFVVIDKWMMVATRRNN